MQRLIFCILLAALCVQSASISQSSQSKYFGCLAECGFEFGSETSQVLMSGQNSTAWVVGNADLEKCLKICRAAGESPKNESGFTYDSREGFDKVELVCVNKISLFPPRVRAKFDLKASEEKNLLRVIEVWRTFAYKDGHLNNSLISRQYAFSSRFEVEYEYSNVQEREYMTVRVFSFDHNGLAIKPHCSPEIIPESLFNGNRDVIQLKLVDLLEEKSVALIKWNGYEGAFPTECEQFITWSSGDDSWTEMKEFDSTHEFTVPLRSDPDTRSHVITVYSRSESVFTDRHQAVLHIDLDDINTQKPLPSKKVYLNWDILVVIGVAVIISIVFLYVLSKIRQEQQRRIEKMDKKRISSIPKVYEKECDVIPEMITPIRPNIRQIRHYEKPLDSPIIPDFTSDSSSAFVPRALPFQLDSTDLSWTKSAPCRFQI